MNISWIWEMYQCISGVQDRYPNVDQKGALHALVALLGLFKVPSVSFV